MSYMDRKNILSEGFFDFLKRLPKELKSMSRAEKKLYKKNPRFKKAMDGIIANGNEIERLIKQST